MRLVPALLLAFLPLCPTARAQGLQAVRPLPGHACMQLNLPPEVVSDPKQGVPVHDAPSSSGHVVGWAPSVLVVPTSQQPAAGFLQVLFPDGRKGWVQAAYLKPWSSPTNPNRRCVPSVMSDGGIGFGFQG